MRLSIKKGLGFGVTSGVITTLGLMVGLFSGTNSRFVVIGGIIMIAVADAFSDALGMHISTESDNKSSAKTIWEITLFAFLGKFILAGTFLLPVVFLELKQAVVISVIWGLLLLGVYSYFLAKERKERATMTVFEHEGIAVVVIVATYFLGEMVSRYLN